MKGKETVCSKCGIIGFKREGEEITITVG